MPRGGGLYSSEQEANFRAANVLHRRGGHNEVLCEARTRTGGMCRQKPLRGSRRCLRHAGPHAARAFRERQLRDLGRGMITPQEFAAHEARRAANRLRDRWKKDPWLPGTTIDLGEHEGAFQQESGLAHKSQPTAPAVLDWLRWKYRRLQMDRKRDAEWVRVLREDYPKRVVQAGQPNAADFESTSASAHGAALWSACGRTPFSKRQNLDRVNVSRPQPQLRMPAMKSRKRESEPSPEAIAALCTKYAPLLNQLFPKCGDDAERQAVVAALHAHDADPQDPKAAMRWSETIRVLNSVR